MPDHRRGLWGLPFVSLGLLSAFSTPAHAAARMPTHVACVGDSITAGAGSSDAASKSYPAQLQILFGSQVSVKNFGHSGATMLSKGFGDLPYEDQTEYQGATDFVKGAGAAAVVDVVIMLGTNDSKPFNWSPAGKPKNDQQYLTDYRAMVEHFTALTPKPEVFLALPLSTGATPCCSISGTVIHDEILPLIKQLAKEKSLPIIDLNTPTATHPEYFVDGVHPNDAAYVIVAKIFHDGLLQDLAPLTGAGGNADAGGTAGSGGAGGAVSAGTGGSAGAGGTAGMSAAVAGSAGTAVGGAVSTGGAASVAGSGAGGSGAAGTGGVPVTGAPAGSDSSGCSVAPGQRKASPLSALLSLSFLLSIIGLRRRPVLHARPRS